MTAALPSMTMRLHRLRLVRDCDPEWPIEDDPVLPGVLEVSSGGYTHLMFCHDTVALLTSLWQVQPYGARGQMVRPVLEPAGVAGPGAVVRLEVVWPHYEQIVGRIELERWQRQLARLAGQAADVLTAAGERGLVLLLAPALAGPVRGGSQRP